MPVVFADRNLLLSILALQLDFVTRDQLISAMNTWVLDKSKSLGEVLRSAGALGEDRFGLLSALVSEHLKQHDGDAQRSLAALSSLDSATRHQLLAVEDDDIHATMMQVGVARPDDSNATKAQAPQPPSHIRYRVLRPHARGGLGEVFVAEDTELGRQVALKQIQDRHADDQASRGRFVLEAEVTGGLELRSSSQPSAPSRS